MPQWVWKQQRTVVRWMWGLRHRIQAQFSTKKELSKDKRLRMQRPLVSLEV